MVRLVQKYLSINNFTDKKHEFEDLFQSHPDFPSLFAITDTLDLLSIENVAVKIQKEQFIELPDTFLAVYKQNVVLAAKNENIVQIDSENEGKKSLSFDEFAQDWDGIVVVVEPNETSGKINLKTNLNWLYYGISVLALIIVSSFYKNFGWGEIMLLLTSITGLIFSVFIVQEKLGVKNEMVSKFCNLNPNASCDSVISSDKGNINKWVNFSDLPILFFGINLLSLFNTNSSSGIIGFLSLVSLPVIAYSIWIQKWQLKKWCLLCLAISFLIILQSTVWIFMKQTFIYSSSSLFSYLFSIILITTFWLSIRPVLMGKMKSEKEASNLKKFKRNYNVLNYLSKEVPVLDGLDKLEGLQFGNEDADVRLLIILSPSCGYCHKAFEEALQLLNSYPEKIFLHVLFNINPENNDNPYKVVVERLLEINNTNQDLVLNAISDWHIEKIGLDKWLKKWNVERISMKVNLQIQMQYDWCHENEFNYTPVKIVNDKIFPSEYDINELKYFLSDLSEEISLRKVI
ncbi:putative membrane protein [Flavobacterium sp. 2755]|uniref:vitamin K epoxide reductase family protein n=1 Tax=Flavobacterium sp. 2755 TaxID=2817765 RepID=UPI0028588E43|nr:vitamin K epoxide reductase family protein [Flavobacterium sp. 2755]MDR6762056.1 putative membrane protein [Flavobacterium sp. 2755]